MAGKVIKRVLLVEAQNRRVHSAFGLRDEPEAAAAAERRSHLQTCDYNMRVLLIIGRK